MSLNTFIISDLHLSDAEPENTVNPLWKKFKRKEFFYDKDFSNFIDHILSVCKDEPIELILNGDIFDFDSVMALPEDIENYPVKKYEKKLGLNPMEIKSVFKIDKVLSEHSIFVEALIRLLKKGHSVIFVTGNHDIELNWKKVQSKIIDYIGNESQVKFCEWFYISNNDTLVEHGHQYDPYCMSLNPIHPVIRKNGLYKIRLPFGNLANRFMINNMGLKNPHNDESYTKTFWEFIKFFFKYELKTQPFMVFSWLYGASKTFIYTFGESFLPANRDPLTYQEKIEDIAEKANSDVSTVISLRDHQAHPAARNPFTLLKELWLDRALFLLFIVWFSWQIFSTSNVFVNISIWWFFGFILSGIPLLLYYAHGISSDIHNNQDLALDLAPISAKFAKVNRVVLGHTHNTQHYFIGKDKDIEYLNPGTWSVFFKDIECKDEIRYQNCVWINSNRESFLYNWDHLNKSLNKIKQSNLPIGKRKKLL